MNNTPVISDFLATHNLNPPDVFREDLEALSLVIDIRSAIEEDLSLLASDLLQSGEPTWAITRSMLDRLYDHVVGGFVCLFTGTWSSVEIICRASLEASVNVTYVLEADTPNRLSQYVSHYFVQASKAIDRYEQLVTRDAIKGGPDWATKARDLLETRQKIVEGVFDHEGIPFGKGGWRKTIIERFKALDREFEYREIYASLSSQVHNDADALIDYIMVTVTEKHLAGATDNAGREVLFWMRHFLYRSLALYSDAAKSYAAKYQLSEAEPIIEDKRQAILAALRRIDDGYPLL
jgi:hypothetical protein